MDIGEPQRIIRIEPVENPVPEKEPVKTPEPEKVPEREPEKVPA